MKLSWSWKPGSSLLIARDCRSLGQPSSMCTTIRQIRSLSVIFSGRPRRGFGSGAGNHAQAAQ
jgi:hypothetical protein